MIAALIVLLLLTLAGLFLDRLSRNAVHPRRFSYIKSYAVQVEHGRLDERQFLELEKEEMTFASPHGYRLRGTYFPLPAGQPARGTLILVHGFSFTRAGMYKFIAMAQRLGFNALAYDQRFHGQSGGTYITFGAQEQDDLRAACDWVSQRRPGERIGVMGESLGAAVVLQFAASDARPAFLIADCPFADLYQQFALRLRADYHLPVWPLLPISLVWMRLRYGFDPRRVSPQRDAAQIETPLLLIHGLADTYVPVQSSRAIAAAKTRGLCRLVEVPGAGHLGCYSQNPAQYEQAVQAFLQQAIG